jgi:26S proteasome regulatory subunit N1
MGKGTIGINPFHTDRSLMSPVAVAGLLATIVSFTDSGARESPAHRERRKLISCLAVILDKSHWMLYFIVMAMYPVRSPSHPLRLSLTWCAALPHYIRRGGQPSPRDRSSWTGSSRPRFPSPLLTTPTSQAVDVVGQAGKPRTISGFQTHQTPVRLGQMERAELATEEYMSYSHVLEGCTSPLSLPLTGRALMGLNRLRVE